MDFKTLIASLIEAAAEDRPDDMLSQLDTAYDADMGGATATINAFAAERAAYEKTIADLKIHNYELLTTVRADEKIEDKSEDDENGDDKIEADLDNLFED